MHETIDWTTVNDAELTKIITELAAEQERRRLDRLQALRDRIEEMLKDEGCTLADLFPELPQPKPRGRPKSRAPQNPGKELSDFGVYYAPASPQV